MTDGARGAVLLERRAALRDALAAGDTLALGRAAARARVTGLLAPVDERIAGRSAFERIGRGLRIARRRRRSITALLPADPSAPAIVLWRRRRVRDLIVLAMACVLLLPAPPRERERNESAAARGPAAAATDVPLVALLGLRGRSFQTTIATIVTAPTADRRPAESAAPENAIAAGPSTAAAVIAGTGNGTVGSGTGNGGQGTGSATTASSRPAPTTAAAPAQSVLGPIPAGYSRFVIYVVDLTTGRPIAGACVYLGTQTCTAGHPYTDDSGRWVQDVPANGTVSYWEVIAEKAGYLRESRRVFSRGGEEQSFSVRLRPR